MSGPLSLQNLFLTSFHLQKFSRFLQYMAPPFYEPASRISRLQPHFLSYICALSFPRGFLFCSEDQDSSFLASVGRIVCSIPSQRTVILIPPWRLEFDPSSDHLGFVLDKVTLEQVLAKHFGLSSSSYSTNCSIFINHSSILCYIVFILTASLNNQVKESESSCKC
jgi:hypothetical protein